MSGPVSTDITRVGSFPGGGVRCRSNRATRARPAGPRTLRTRTSAGAASFRSRRCHRRPGPPVRPGDSPAPARWSPPVSAEAQPARSSAFIGAAVSIVAAVAAYLGVQYLMGPSVSLPDRLAGAERLDDQGSRRFQRYIDDEGERYRIEVEAGVYGGLGPEFCVILVDATAVETTDQLFDALVLGFSQAGAVIDRSPRSAVRGSRATTGASRRAPARDRRSHACGATTTTWGSCWRCPGIRRHAPPAVDHPRHRRGVRLSTSGGSGAG